MRASLLLTACAIASAFAAPAKRADYAVKDSHAVPSKWKRGMKPSPDHTISLRIGLKQHSFAELERHLYEVSDPDHARYGNHLSASEVNDLVAPSEQGLGAVHSWLEDNNVRLDQLQYSPAKDWVFVELPVAEVESLLDTEYHVYENDEGSRLVRTPEYSLPQSLHEHVDVIQPTNYFVDVKAMGRPFRFVNEPDQDLTELISSGHVAKLAGDTSLSAVCDPQAVTSLCLRTLYNTVNYTPQVPDKNYVAITAYLNETANYSDFHTYMSQQRKDASPSYQYNYTIIANATDHQGKEPPQYYGDRDIEANLDVQTVGGIVYPTRFRTYATGGLPPYQPNVNETENQNEPYLVWVDYMLGLSDIPYIISTSYGDDEQTVPPAYAQRVCNSFAQLGARGASLLFSSGDSGVGESDTCYVDGVAQFTPAFPAGCPYVTAVGATRNLNPEIVAYNSLNGFVSGSGLSNYFSRPSYQDSAVRNYLSEIGSLNQGLYNSSGRAYPDIAAQGYHFVVTYGGQNIIVDGTSAASPAAAGILTNVNDALLAAGKSPLGFLNPWLYKSGYKGFNDIVNGSSTGCDTSGFPAKKGWDLASGFGTPDFKKIVAEFLGSKTSSW